jgi:hypothetical protein
MLMLRVPLMHAGARWAECASAKAHTTLQRGVLAAPGRCDLVLISLTGVECSTLKVGDSVLVQRQCAVVLLAGGLCVAAVQPFVWCIVQVAWASCCADVATRIL